MIRHLIKRLHGASPPLPRGRGYLRDIVYGAMDGSVTTFAIVAGVAGAGLSPLIILALGFANLLADGFSMAAGNYSGTKTELDDIRRLRREHMLRIEADPDAEKQDLVRILHAKGLDGEVAEAASAQIAQNREIWLETILEGQYGLAPVDPHPMLAAVATFGAFLAAGFVPLLPFVVGASQAFGISAALTLASFFAIGVFKSRWSLSPWWRSGIETLLIGGAAALIAFAVGSLFSVHG